MSHQLEHAQNHLGSPLKADGWTPTHWVSDSMGVGWEFLTSSQVILLLVWGPHFENHFRVQIGEL